MVFKAPTRLQQPTNMIFGEIHIWVSCQNMPLSFMHSTIHRNVGENIVRVFEVDSGKYGNCATKFV